MELKKIKMPTMDEILERRGVKQLFDDYDLHIAERSIKVTAAAGYLSSYVYFFREEILMSFGHGLYRKWRSSIETVLSSTYKKWLEFIKSENIDFKQIESFLNLHELTLQEWEKLNEYAELFSWSEEYCETIEEAYKRYEFLRTDTDAYNKCMDTIERYELRFGTKICKEDLIAYNQYTSSIAKLLEYFKGRQINDGLCEEKLFYLYIYDDERN